METEEELYDKETATATWDVELNATCPYCNTYQDIFLDWYNSEDRAIYFSREVKNFIELIRKQIKGEK